MLQKNSSFKFAAFLLSLIILIQFGCKKTDDIVDPTVLEPPVISNDAIKVTATISGSVIDENNQPVANATVTSDTYTASTDAMGNFVFKNISISAANGHVTIIKSGYFKGIRSFVTEAGKNNYVKIQLIKQSITAIITAAAGGTVTTSAATISFPPNAFVTASGAAYTGSVKVYATWIDPTAANLPLVIPGDLRGINSSNGEFLLKSYGMVGAELKDDNGNILKIAPGKTATITFPIMGSLQGSAPGSIPLWHFDEATARWKQEGSAVKTGNNYTAQVNKFSFWNVDVPGNFINLDLRLINGANNLPLANTMVKITSLVTNTYAYDHTNDSGYVSGYVPKNENLKLEVIAGTACNNNAVVYTQNIGPYSNNASLGNISVTLPTNQVINFTGTVKDCNNQAVTNGYVSLSLASGSSAIAYTNAAGTVNFSVIYCGGNTQAYSYNAVDLTTGAYSTVSTGTATTSNVDLGTISACGNVINTNGVYIAGTLNNMAVLWKDGIPSFLSTPINCISDANDVTVVGNDVYVLGALEDTLNSFQEIIIWKNGIMSTVLRDNQYITNNPTCLVVENNDIYFVYTQYAGNNLNVVLNKNGTNTILSNGPYPNVKPISLKINQGDVYVMGEADSLFNGNTSLINKAVYWKNGQFTDPGYSGGDFRNADFDNAGNLYYVGSTRLMITSTNPGGYSNVASLYKSGNLFPYKAWNNDYIWSECQRTFFDNSSAETYSGGTVLETLNPNLQGIQNLVYWKGPNITRLTNYNPTLNQVNAMDMLDMTVKNSKVYSLVFDVLSTAKYYYFENNIALNVTGVTNTNNFQLKSIFVK